MKLIFDDNGTLIDAMDEPESVDDKIIDVESDPYWQAPIPKNERKHRRPIDPVFVKEVIFRIVIIILFFVFVSLVMVLMGL